MWLGFSADIAKLPFIVEVETGARISRGFFEAERSGFFTLDLDFHVGTPLFPLEIRLISQESAFDGQASLLEVRLEMNQSVP